MRAPIRPELAFHFRAQPAFDRRNGLRRAIIKLQRRDMLIEIRGTRRAATERVDLGPRQTIQIIELHRRQRRAQLRHLRRPVLQHAAFVVRADDEHAHVLFRRRQHGRPVQRIDKVPVQVHVIEFVRLDDSRDHARHRVRGEPDEADAAVLLELPRGFQATAAPQREFEQLLVVDAVDTQEIDVLQLQVAHRLVERRQKFLRIGARADLGLHNHPAHAPIAGESSQVALPRCRIRGRFRYG